MKNNKILVGILGIALSLTACKKDLDISNTNAPTPESAQNESGVISFAQGGIYRNGFFDLKYSDGVYGRYWPGAMGFQELMGDIIGAEAANAFMNQIGCPNSVTLDNGTVVLNPSNPKTQYELVRYANQNAQGGSNTTFYQWAYSYNMITSANTILDLASKVQFSGANAATKKATLQAWAYWWKGFAYGQIGSMYYAGIIQNETTAAAKTNGNYVTKEAIITESNANYDKCVNALAGVTDAATYNSIMAKVLPNYVQIGKGGVLSTAEWTRTINTMKARNILVNTLKDEMTATQWSTILALTSNGVKSTDKIFTGRSDANGDFLGTGISVADKASQNAATGSTNTYKVSERWIQEFRAGDKRFDNNVLKLASVGLFNTDRGNAFNTRYTLKNGGNGMAGVITYSNQAAGANEISLAATFEENELMKAEASIMTGKIDDGVKAIDAVRTYQGAGLTALATGLSKDEAYEELRSERRIALAFKGLSFYDARRWDVINPAKGRTNAVVVSFTGAVNTKAKIVYGYLDYWDVPDNELAYNPAAPGSAPTKNPK
ncbi:MAG: RagB/SusD family nutrient uptake outer membrane protein [Sediminibacterium sp.]